MNIFNTLSIINLMLEEKNGVARDVNDYNLWIRFK